MRNVHILSTEIKDVATGAGKVTQFVKFLPYKREDLNLNPSTHIKVDVVVTPALTGWRWGNPGACRSSRLVNQNVFSIWTKKKNPIKLNYSFNMVSPILSFL